MQNGTMDADMTTPGAAITFERTGNYSKGKLHFKTKTNADEDGDVNTQMTISDNGNVGIGTTDPQAKLDVNGGIHSTGAITSDADITAQKLKVNANGSITNGYVNFTNGSGVAKDVHIDSGLMYDQVEKSLSVGGDLTIQDGNLTIEHSSNVGEFDPLYFTQ